MTDQTSLDFEESLVDSIKRIADSLEKLTKRIEEVLEEEDHTAWGI